jgi:general secretion pathway protein K
MCRRRNISPVKGRLIRPPADEQGVVLLMVLWLLALISAVVLAMAVDWRTEITLLSNHERSRQAYYLAEAGIYYALGKIVEIKLNEQKNAQPNFGTLEKPQTWKIDGSPHILELAGGQAEVRVMDEAGKINLNRATPEILSSLFRQLGLEGKEAQGLVDSILDWRDKDSLTRPQGAESSYYLSLNPPYAAKDGPFDAVEELAWVKGFSATEIPRLGKFLTVYDSGTLININAASLEILQVLGFSADQGKALLQARGISPIRDMGELQQSQLDKRDLKTQLSIGLNSSAWFSILATGRTNPKGSRHTIKAVVRIEVSQIRPWEIFFWADDYPG